MYQKVLLAALLMRLENKDKYAYRIVKNQSFIVIEQHLP